MERERLETNVSEDQDRLIDVFLREELGGETPPDLTGEILARAFPERKRGPRFVIATAGEILARVFPARVPRFAIATAAAIAAVLMLAVVGWMTLGHRSPAPEALEAPRVAEADEPAPEALEAPKVVEVVKADEPAPEALEAPKVVEVVKADEPAPEVLEAPKVVEVAKADEPAPEVLEAPKVVKVADGGKAVRPCSCASHDAVAAAGKPVADGGNNLRSTTKKYSGRTQRSTTKKYGGKTRRSTTKKYGGKNLRSTTKKYSGEDQRSTAELNPSKSECGFRGRVLGVVVEDGKESSFAFKVVRVLRVRKDNKAENPKSLAGRTVRVGPSCVCGEDGKWHHVKLQRAFINGLRKGQKFALDIWSCERGVFAILELSGKQRKWAEQEKKKQERVGVK